MTYTLTGPEVTHLIQFAFAHRESSLADPHGEHTGCQ